MPSAVLVGVTFLIEPNYLPFAIAGATAWTGYRIFTGTSGLTGQVAPQPAMSKVAAAADKAGVHVNRNTLGVADPDLFQEFPLTAKTQTSPNTAMWVDISADGLRNVLMNT